MTSLRSKGASQPPPNYFSRRVQWRLLCLVGAFLVTLYAMNEARKPHHWHWLFADTNNPLDKTEPASQNIKQTPVDTRLQPTEESRSAPLDVIRALPNTENLKKSTEGSSEHLLGVNVAALQTVEDDSPLRSAEKQAWFNLWQVLHETPPSTLQQHSLGPVGFVPLFRQSQVYRGKVIEVQGTVHAVYRSTAPSNEMGIVQYFVCWVRPAGGANSPLAIYVSELPEDFPQGDNVREEISVTGFFFKRMAYLAKDGSRTAPVVQAKSVRWKKTTPPSSNAFETLEATDQFTVVTIIAIGMAILAVALTLGVYWLSVKQRPSHPYRPAEQATSEQLGQLNQFDVKPSPPEALKQLAEEDSF